MLRVKLYKDYHLDVKHHSSVARDSLCQNKVYRLQHQSLVYSMRNHHQNGQHQYIYLNQPFLCNITIKTCAILCTFYGIGLPNHSMESYQTAKHAFHYSHRRPLKSPVFIASSNSYYSAQRGIFSGLSICSP
jgi:hypothetical protein